LVELEQIVTAERLREILWDERSRPSLQWIRKETKRRMLPHLPARKAHSLQASVGHGMVFAERIATNQYEVTCSGKTAI